MCPCEIKTKLAEKARNERRNVATLPQLGFQRAQRQQGRREVRGDLGERRVEGPQPVAQQAAVVGVAFDDHDVFGGERVARLPGNRVVTPTRGVSDWLHRPSWLPSTEPCFDCNIVKSANPTWGVPTGAAAAPTRRLV